MHSLRRDDRGFTIIELMIATSILSIMLIMVTVMMINMGNLYYKGISQSRIQDNVRSVTDEVSKHLELGDTFFLSTSGDERSYCIGSTRYTFILYKQLGADSASPNFQSRHVLWRDANPTPQSCPSVLPDLTANTPSAGGVELMAPNSRLLDFTITGTSPYSLSLTEAYGANDLLCDNAVGGDCTSHYSTSSEVYKLVSGSVPSPAGTIRCRGEIGDQFCATATLSTTVVRRLP